MVDKFSDDLAWNLRQLVELDQGFGVAFVGRTAASALPPPSSTVLVAPRPATAIVAYATPRPVAVAPTAPVTGLPAADLGAVAHEVAACVACGLCAGRKNAVPGEGDPAARVVFVGEGPVAEDDLAGRPFLGAAGQLLEAMIKAMGLTREQVFLSTVIKCRPPGNRPPEPAEIAACLPYVQRQIRAIRPTVICTLGNMPLRAIMNDATLGITTVHGTQLAWEGIPLIPTYDPGYLLRNPDAKKPCWDDLKRVLAVMGRVPPKRG